MDDYFSLTFASDALVDEEADNYLTTIEGFILCTDPYSERRRRAGRLRIFYAHLDRAMADGYEPYYVLDLKSEMAGFFSTLFDQRTLDFKRSVYRLAGEAIYSHDLLILDRLEILPAYRGRGLGLACLYRSMQQHSHGCGLVALKCFPLQFEVKGAVPEERWARSMKMADLGVGLAACRSKLLSYYARLGFERVGKTEFMILNPALVQPSFESLGFRE